MVIILHFLRTKLFANVDVIFFIWFNVHICNLFHFLHFAHITEFVVILLPHTPPASILLVGSSLLELLTINFDFGLLIFESLFFNKSYKKLANFFLKTFYRITDKNQIVGVKNYLKQTFLTCVVTTSITVAQK